jgi:RHS repeat-associated protein
VERTQVLQNIRHEYNYYRRDHLGNNCAVWDATNDTTLQQTVYYASGLPMAVSSNQSTQPYKYNGKEFIEMHGLDVTDLGFRSVHNARGRFDNIDPLCELSYHSSPYAISANNPINNIDVLGLESMNFNATNFKMPGGYNRTEVNVGGIIKKHTTGDGDYRVFLVDEFGKIIACIGVENPDATYTVGQHINECGGYTAVGAAGAVLSIGLAKDIYDNTVSAGQNFSLAFLYSHFQIGDGKPVTFNMSSIDFSGATQKDLGLTGMKPGEVRNVNLFDAGPTNPAALAFGRVRMIYHGNNQFSIVGDKSSRFDFWKLIDPAASTGRNVGNLLGAAINYNVITMGVVGALIPTVFGGAFDVNFVGTVTIPE